VSETHSVPTVHVTAADGTAIKTYAVAQAAAARAALSPFYNQPKPAPFMAGFSSRGPNMADGNVLKPDLTAPGVDIIASVSASLTPAQHDGVVAGTFVPPAAYESYQGTSMSSPHVAGLALLLKQAHPTWSPAAIKSALMTTTYSTLNDGLAGAQNGLLPWSQGTGHVSPNKATDPGLVYDAAKADFVQYQCKMNKALVVPASDCTTFGTLDETYNLNMASITVASVQGTVTVRRKVTNVGGASATYNATASVPGFSTVVTPSTLTLAPGATGSFTVKLTTTTAQANVWQFGRLVWNDGNHSVSIPVSAQVAQPLVSPAEITSDKTSGTKLFTVKTGYSGVMKAVKGGLKEATTGEQVSLVPNGSTEAQLKAACSAGVNTDSVRVYNVPVAAGVMAARFALRQQDSGPTDDNDMGVMGPNGFWKYSGKDYTNEAVQLASPAAGNYKVCVVAWGSDEDTATHKLMSWLVTAADVGGKFTVAVPGKVVAGTYASLGLSWSGLEAGKRYLGAIQFLDQNNVMQATTVVRVETGAAAVPTAQTDRAALKSSTAN